MTFGTVKAKGSPQKTGYQAIVNFQHGGHGGHFNSGHWKQYSDKSSYLHGIKYDDDDLLD